MSYGRTPTLPSDCAALIAKYGAQNVTPPGLSQAQAARYSTCVATWRALNVRAGRAPTDDGKAASTAPTTRTPRRKYVGPRAATPDLTPRKQFQPSEGQGKQAVSETAPEGASEGTNWKLVGLGVAVLALVGGGYWWAQQDAESDAE